MGHRVCLAVYPRLPLCPDEQTSSDRPGVSQTLPQPDSCTAQRFVSLDRLAGAADQRWRDVDAELFPIDCQFELAGCTTGSLEGFSPLPPCEEGGNQVADRRPLLQSPSHRSTRSSIETTKQRGDNMSREDENKTIVGRWFTKFWGETCDLGIVDELAAPDMLLQYHFTSHVGDGKTSRLSWPAPCPRTPVGKCDLPVRLF